MAFPFRPRGPSRTPAASSPKNPTRSLRTVASGPQHPALCRRRCLIPAAVPPSPLETEPIAATCPIPRHHVPFPAPPPRPRLDAVSVDGPAHRPRKPTSSMDGRGKKATPSTFRAVYMDGSPQRPRYLDLLWTGPWLVRLAVQKMGRGAHQATPSNTKQHSTADAPHGAEHISCGLTSSHSRVLRAEGRM